MVINQSISLEKPLVKQSPIVIHVINGMAFGGIENICLEIIKNSPPDAKNVLLYLDSERTEMLPLFKEIPNLTIINQDYKSDRRLPFIFNLALKFREIKPQAILLHVFGLHLFVGLAARIARVPKIMVCPGNPVPEKDLSRLKVWKNIVLFSRLLKIPIHSCSQTVHNSLQVLTKLPRNSYPINYGCDVKAIAARAEKSRQQRSTNSPKVIGMVARLNTIKDHQTLIAAFNLVHRQFADTQLWLIGDGEQKETLQNLVDELNLSEQVIFWGDRSDIPELLGQMDIYAFSTTEEEGFGIALIEAMAAKLPIVASNASACCEVLGQGKAGALIEQGDAKALATALGNFLASEEKRREWGNKAYQYAATNHNIQQCADKWYSILLGN
ncbi:glycosyltransferase [Pleurocapsa sp. FMAR1]|uniref:glycosyltransferase n=1 Tax=Pleurocapsa sp. FMAR1 TaxID=3040204 RepID=UPI0029C9441D|nr:glycosyltransferase [Pleurocapsa sp. FMAR1]